MTEETSKSPNVYDLSKDDDESKSQVSEEVEDEYPDEIDSPSDNEGDVPDGEPKGDAADCNPEEQLKTDDEEPTLTQKLDLSYKLDGDSGFSSVSKGDLILLDTPLEGAKVGEVTEIGETWTGITRCKADTGAKQYTVTPFDDEFSTTYIGKVSEQMELHENVLSQLSPVTIDGLSEGKQVCLDVPHIGPTKGEVTDIVPAGNEGNRVTIKSGDVHFVVHSEPSPEMVKEQPYVVGEIN